MAPMRQTQVTGWRNDDILAEVQRWTNNDPVTWVPPNESNTAVAAVVDFASLLPSRRRGVTGTMRLVAASSSSSSSGDTHNHHHNHHHQPTTEPGTATETAEDPPRLHTYHVDGQAWLLTPAGFDACEYIGYPVVSFIGLESVKMAKEVQLIAEEVMEINRRKREAEEAAAARRAQEMEEAVEAYEAWQRERDRVVLEEVQRIAVVARMCTGLADARADYEARMATQEAACAAIVEMRNRMDEATVEEQARLREEREAEEREWMKVVVREVKAIAEMARVHYEKKKKKKEEEKEKEEKEQKEEEEEEEEARGQGEVGVEAAAEEVEGVEAVAAVSPVNQEMDKADQECQAQGQEERKRKRDVAEDMAHPSEPPQKKREEGRETNETEMQALIELSRAALAVIDRHRSCSGGE